jgi:hypothetical protein
MHAMMIMFSFELTTSELKEIIMKRWSCFIAFLLLITVNLLADKGEIVFEEGDYYVIDSNMGHTVAEWYSGCVPFSKNNSSMISICR